jgi:hypothetical protein
MFDLNRCRTVSKLRIGTRAVWVFGSIRAETRCKKVSDITASDRFCNVANEDTDLLW